MLRLLGIIYLVSGLLVCVPLVMWASTSGNALSLTLALGVFFSALLVPAVLFALADIVRATQETAKTVQGMARAQSEPTWAPPPRIE